MNKDEISTLLDSFFLTKEELASRIVFKEFANSLSDIIVDDFTQNYLLNNHYLNVYLSHTDGNMLVKKIKEFMAFVLTADVDEVYVQRIHFIGSIHYSIKLDPAKVSYGFWAINEVLNKMADVNEIVKENRGTISKLLRVVEHLMNDGYYIQKEKHAKNHLNEFTGLNAQNDLYMGYSIHKFNIKKISKALALKDKTLLQGIEDSSDKCIFGKIFLELQKDKKYEYLLDDKVQEITKVHNLWHEELVIIKELMEQEDYKNTQVHYKNLETLTEKLKNILDIILDSSLENGQLSLNSGMKAIRKMTDLFYDKNLKMVDTVEVEEYVYKNIEQIILNELSWAVDDIAVSSESLNTNNYAVTKQIRYKTKNIFIGIEISTSRRSVYILEMINLLLEVFDIHLSIKERELSLIEFADKAESANKSKDMFLANMSHELRTPLNAITGFSQILMMKKDTPDSTKKYIEKINIAGNNLLDLVNTILDFAKLEAGKMQFKPSLSNISDLLTEVRILVTPLANKKNITLKMPNIISLNLYIDKTLFKQVLINLLTNAVKFTHKEGTVTLNIVYDADQHKYIFEVKDNGIGLSKEDASKLFQAFSQVDNSYQKEHKGTGLGLMISKKIVEDLHKGKIWVKSQKGEGSSFFITMPTPMIESHTYSVNEAPEGSKDLLIVEDSEVYQKLLVAHLKDYYNITITDTINKSKDLLSKVSYDVIILDFFLTDGISSEILQFMEEENISIPTIVVSAEDEIHISSSLKGSSNLECIINKKNVDEICTLLKGGSYS